MNKLVAASLLNDIVLVHYTFKNAILDTRMTHYRILSSERNSPCHQFCKDKNKFKFKHKLKKIVQIDTSIQFQDWKLSQGKTAYLHIPHTWQ